MDADRLRDLLRRVQSGELDLDKALGELKTLPFAELGYARVDHHRQLRVGAPEVILGEGKTAEQIAGVARALIEKRQNVLVTRLSEDKAGVLLKELPVLRYAAVARVATYEHEPVKMRDFKAVA